MQGSDASESKEDDPDKVPASYLGFDGECE